MKIQLLFFAAIIFVVVSCSRNPKTMPDSGADTGLNSIKPTFNATLIFGSGGGFTGATVRYIIPPDGTVTRIRTKMPQDTMVVKKLTNKELNSLQQEALQLRLHQMNFKFPGNMSYFIEYAGKDEKNTITWGDFKNPVPPDVQNYYNRAMVLITVKE